MPPPRVVLRDDEAGLALLVRRDGAPVGFVLEPATAGRAFQPDDVARLLRRVDPDSAGRVRPPTRAAEAPVASLTIAVCTHDRPDRLARCVRSLRALRAGSAAASVEVDLLVVDDAPSTEATRAVIAALPDVRYVREPHVGLDFARNRALREARTTFVAYVDDDVVVDPGWLDGFVEAVVEHPDAAAVTGPVLPYELATPTQVLFERFGGFGHRFTKARFGAVREGDPIY